MSTPILSIKYDDANPATYEGVTLSMDRDKPRELFSTGNPTVDYNTAAAVVYRRFYNAGVDVDDVPLMGSSTIDHFIMDGGELNEEPTPEQIRKALDNAEKYEGDRW
jgi:hypothetical protein